MTDRKPCTYPAWQPIETAPKDGTPVWCYWPREDECQGVGWFVPNVTEPYWSDPADSQWDNPTHWMPLPPTPGSDKCDLADPCPTAHDLATERDTLDGLLSETKDRLAAAEAEIARLREALLDAAAHLVGAASAYRKYASRSRTVGRSSTDPFFTTRLMDFDAATARVQAALAETAATPTIAPAPADDGWIAWEGGDCPVAGGTRVEVVFRSRLGSAEGFARNWDWSRGPAPVSYDIVAYRIAKGTHNET